MTLEDAEKTVDLLNSAVFRDAIDRIDADIVARWREAETFEEREQLHKEQQALSQVIGELFQIVEKAAEDERKKGEKDGLFSSFLKIFKWRQ